MLLGGPLDSALMMRKCGNAEMRSLLSFFKKDVKFLNGHKKRCYKVLQGHIRRISKYLLAFSAEIIGQKELFSLMSYGLLIEFVHCLFKDLVKGRQFSAFETHFIKKKNELLFQKCLPKLSSSKTLFCQISEVW